MLEIASHIKKSMQVLSDFEAKGLATRLFTIVGHWLPDSQRDLIKAVSSLTKQTGRRIMDEAARNWSLPSDL